MPISNYLQISPILDQLVKMKPASIIDIGCGLGIYGSLARIYLEGDNLYDRTNLTWNRKENWTVRIDAVEGFEKYITDLHRFIYNDIIIGSATDILPKLHDKAYDLVIAIDILEHFSKKGGTDFIRELVRIGKSVIIATPSIFENQQVPENPFENHLSVWNREDLLAFGFEIIEVSHGLIGIMRNESTEYESEVNGGIKETSVRLYQSGDEDGIIRLFNNVFDREMTRAEWQWKYVRGRERVYASLAVNHLGAVIAHYGGLPQRMVHNSKEIHGMAIGDVMVHPSYRGTKLFKKIAELLPPVSALDGFTLGYGFPNERAMRLPEILGIYEKVENVWESVKEVRRINNTARFIYKLFPLDFEDERVDALWNSLKNWIRLAVIRDRDYLKWRYQEHPLFRYELWGVKKRFQQKLIGFAVLRREGEELLLIDFLCPLRHLVVLFQKIENYAVVSGSRKLRLWHPEYLNKRFEDLGFTVSKSGTCIPRTTHPAWLKKDEIKGHFFYTMGDTDFK